MIGAIYIIAALIFDGALYYLYDWMTNKKNAEKSKVAWYGKITHVILSILTIALIAYLFYFVPESIMARATQNLEFFCKVSSLVSTVMLIPATFLVMCKIQIKINKRTIYLKWLNYQGFFDLVGLALADLMLSISLNTLILKCVNLYLK